MSDGPLEPFVCRRCGAGGERHVGSRQDEHGVPRTCIDALAARVAELELVVSVEVDEALDAILRDGTTVDGAGVRALIRAVREGIDRLEASLDAAD